MTLIIDGCHTPSNLVMCTSDSKVVTYLNYHKNGSTGKPIPLKNNKEKVLQLTDRVLIRTGGVEGLGKLFIKKLKKRIKSDDPLENCKKHAEDIYAEMVEQKSKGKGSMWLKYLYDERGLPVAINGFYADGTTGLIILVDNEWLEVNHNERWVTSMVAPPSKKDNKIMEYLNRFSRIKEPGTHHMFAEFWETHKELYQINKQTISEDMHIHGIKKVNEEYRYFNIELPDVDDEEKAMYIYKALMEMDVIDQS